MYEEQLKHIEKKKENKWAKIAGHIWTGLSLLSVLLLVLKFTVYQQVNVIGQSMQPNYFEGHRLLLNKLDNELERGQVVSFYEFEEMSDAANFVTKTFPNLSPVDVKFLLKRVIGLPGEEVEIIGSDIIIYNDANPEGKILNEDYIPLSTKEQMETRCGSYGTYTPRTVVPADSYYLMGDNRCASLDSRDPNHGPFHIDLFFGQEELRYWPFSKSKSFALPTYTFSPIDPASELELKAAQEMEKQKELENRVEL